LNITLNFSVITSIFLVISTSTAKEAKEAKKVRPGMP